MPQFGMRTSGHWRCIWTLVLALLVPMAIELVASPTPVQAQGFVIREIRVAGNRRVEPETVRSYLRFNIGDHYDPGKVDQSIKSLFATGLFSDVRIDREGAGVLVTVVENPVINQVAFEGNKEVEKETLRNEVQLKQRAVYTRARVQADVQRILDVYRRQGRFAARVDPKIIELDNNRVNLVFEIDEGGATKVKAINFIGNRAFSDSQLRDIITTSQSGLFDFLKGTNIYDPDRLALDKELLRQYYMKNGYADVRVVSAGAELDRDGSGFFITFVLDEGELFNFGAIDIQSSLANVDPKSLRGELLTVSGQLFNQSEMDKTVERLTLVISEQGYAFARVRPRAARDPSGRAINVTYLIDEGPRVYIERINIIGNQRTRDYVIRREFRLAEGDAYNPLMVDKAKKRLQVLGFFKKVEIKRRPGSAPDRVVLDVELDEQSTGELSFGAGYSTSEGVIGDVSITERNLMGRGQFLRLRLAGSLERMQIDLSFTEPRFLDRNLAAGFDLFHKVVHQLLDAAFRLALDGGCLAPRFPALGEPLADQLVLAREQRDRQRAGWRLARHPGGGGRILDLAVGNEPVLRQAQSPQGPHVRLLLLGRLGACRTWGRRELLARGRRRPLLLPDHGEDHPRRPGDRRPHHGPGRRGCPPARPVLQGRRDHSRLQPGRLRPPRPADRRRARRRYLLGDDGGGALSAAVHPRRPRHEGRRVRRCGLAVRGRRGRQGPQYGMPCR